MHEDVFIWTVYLLLMKKQIKMLSRKLCARLKKISVFAKQLHLEKLLASTLYFSLPYFGNMYMFTVEINGIKIKIWMEFASQMIHMMFFNSHLFICDTGKYFSMLTWAAAWKSNDKIVLQITSSFLFLIILSYL